MEQGHPLSLRVLATGDETGGEFGVVIWTLPPFGTGYHLRRHDRRYEGCYVISGLVALTSHQATVTLAAGDWTLLPPGEHTCWNPSVTPARLLLIVAPGASADELQRVISAGGGREPAP